jgi:hypothetical protein
MLGLSAKLDLIYTQPVVKRMRYSNDCNQYHNKLILNFTENFKTVMEINKDKEITDLASKLFDEQTYASMILHTDEAMEKHKAQIKHLIELVTKEKHKYALPELYTVLKREKAGIHLVYDAIESKEGVKHLKTLYATIWESNLDASPYIVELVRAFFEVDILTAVEIFTVITNNCENTSIEQIDEALDVFKEMVLQITEDKQALSLEILDWLEQVK